ncbi:sigma 54-interacting response regulator [Chitinophaga sp. CF418]|uniref:sigma 54-interacting response regulator n=1 Tax=Chitinophaga sp. CF418 TaxID=1855287 RepID=UPI0009163543|nr:sigma 54-interacting response regulator [Chitinophaga sp. CF418]SHN36001.1 regulatory protein, Fis family [Chitinophaga sp. CF418]
MRDKILIVEDELLVARDLEVMLQTAGYDVVGIARTAKEALISVDRTGVKLVLLDIYLEGDVTGIELAAALNERNVAFVYLSANSNKATIDAAGLTRPYGFLVKPFREKDVLVALEIARARHQNSTEAQLRREILAHEQLLQTAAGNAGTEQQLLAITMVLQSYLPFDFIEIGVCGGPHARGFWRGFLRLGFSEYQSLGREELCTMSGLEQKEIDQYLFHGDRETIPSFYANSAFTEMIRVYSDRRLFARLFALDSHMVCPLMTDNGFIFYLNFYSRPGKSFNRGQLHFLDRIRHSLITVFRELHMAGLDNIAVVPKKGATLNAGNDVFPGIIGRSKMLLSALDMVKQVSAVDSSVLILGETGTGKEKIAENIHLLSARRNGPMVKVNCAALPFSLIESELFGHEKGAFTGAVSRRIGKFEQAHGGTLFLDEIGDVPPDVQVKLLRALQEREIERIGGRGTVKVNVRIVAATNKDLEHEMAEGRFRMDLYYRLNVFPVWMPPLRERLEDIPLLVDHFIRVYNERYQKKMEGIATSALHHLMNYHWPGNIRELENCIERSLVLANGHLIQHVLISSPRITEPVTATSIKTIEEVEREHIIIVLDKCNNKIYGVGGAAEMLNIPPTTLASKIKKLGISRG